MIRPQYLLSAALFLGLLLPWIVRDGMFLDGVTYAAISRNLAHGLGTFWAPHYTDILYPQFFEHPPLAFGIQSLFFRVFGDGLATERIYTLFTALVSLYLLARVWILFSDTPQRKALWWLPVLLWIATPVVFWSYRNNMLENTLTIFVLGATWFTGKAMLKKQFWWLLPAGTCILAAFLTKGPVGLFPLMMPALWWIVGGKKGIGRALLETLILILVPVALFGMLSLLMPEASHSIGNYISQQLLPSLANEREISGDGRFGILLDLISVTGTPLLIILIIAAISKKDEDAGGSRIMRLGWFFILAGLTASLPLILTLKQHDYYLVPSIPFIAIGMSLLVPFGEMRRNPALLTETPLLRWLAAGVVVFFLILSVILNLKPVRDHTLLADVRKITSTVPAGSHISVPDTLCSDWRLIAYLSREANISLDPRTPESFYLTKKKAEIPDSIAEGYRPVVLELALYQMFIRKVTGGN